MWGAIRLGRKRLVLTATIVYLDVPAILRTRLAVYITRQNCYVDCYSNYSNIYNYNIKTEEAFTGQHLIRSEVTLRALFAHHSHWATCHRIWQKSYRVVTLPPL